MPLNSIKFWIARLDTLIATKNEAASNAQDNFGARKATRTKKMGQQPDVIVLNPLMNPQLKKDRPK